MIVARSAAHRPAVCALGVLLAVGCFGCSDRGGPLSPSAERGRQVYRARCASCHASDPANAGAVGPPLKGAPRDLLEAKVLRGTYPPGYAPKRRTHIMPAMPALAPEIPGLTDFLR